MILKGGSMIHFKRAQVWSHRNLALNFEPAPFQLCGLASEISAGLLPPWGRGYGRIIPEIDIMTLILIGQETEVQQSYFCNGGATVWSQEDVFQGLCS